MAWSSSALSHLIAMNGHFISTMTLLLPIPHRRRCLSSTTRNHYKFLEIFFLFSFRVTQAFFFSRFATFTRSSVVYFFTHLAHVPFICNDSLLICFYQQIGCNDFSSSLITPFNSIWNVLFFFSFCLSQSLFLRQKKKHSFLIDWS